MSVRAHKILVPAVLETEPSFNLWHDQDLLEFFKRDSGYAEYEDGSHLEISVSLIKEALKYKKLWVKDDYRPEQLKKDIEGLKDDDIVEYECF